MLKTETGLQQTGGQLLRADNLRVCFQSDGRRSEVVRGVSFEIERGRTLGLVGESGCGKSVTSLALMQLLECPPAQIAGRVFLGGTDLLELSADQLRQRRGKDMAMIFQEPMTSLNPVFTIGDQIAEAMLAHQDVPDAEAWTRAVEALREVNIPGPEAAAGRYPHELSGGMKQRAMIALALINRPGLLIADEPTTALDVTVQAQILELLRTLQNGRGMGMLFITHDLAVVAEIADEVAVMYAGRIVEQALADDFFRAPLHPYAQALLESLPETRGRGEKLRAIPGTVPGPDRLPPGCKFADRCPKATDLCRRDEPELLEKFPGHRAACHHAERSAV